MKKNHLYIILASIAWAVTGIFVSALDGYGFTTSFLSAVRSVLPALIIGILLLITDRKAFKVRLKDIWVFFGTGILSFSFFTYCYYISITNNGMAVAAVLLYTAPVFVSIISAVVFKTALTKHNIIALVLSLTGCAFVSGILEVESSVSVLGILTGLGSGLGYALYTIFGEVAIRKGYKSGTISFYTFAFASIATVILTISSKQPSYSFDIKLILILILFALVTAVFPYLLYTKGLEGTEPSTASILATCEPLAAAVLGVVVIHEELSFPKVIGILLILSSLLVAGRQKES